jgi:hypothetical protein
VKVAMGVSMESAVLNLLKKAQTDMDQRLDTLTVELMSRVSGAHVTHERECIRTIRNTRAGSSQSEGQILVAAGRRDRVAGSRVGLGRVACDRRRRP